METLAKGDVVILPFPYSNLKEQKRRPAMIAANLKGKDIILCQITSQHNKDSYSISLAEKDFTTGSLKKDSEVRPNRIFTAEKSLIDYKAGTVNTEKIQEIEKRIVEIFTGKAS